jgi:hypothetical protein
VINEQLFLIGQVCRVSSSRCDQLPTYIVHFRASNKINSSWGLVSCLPFLLWKGSTFCMYYISVMLPQKYPIFNRVFHKHFKPSACRFLVTNFFLWPCLLPIYINTQTIHWKSIVGMLTQQSYLLLKTLYPGGIRTQVFCSRGGCNVIVWSEMFDCLTRPLKIFGHCTG